MKKDSQMFRVVNHDFTTTGVNTQLISAHGQLFWYQFRQDACRNKWYQAVQYIGSKKQANCYTYTLEYGPHPGDSSRRSILYTRATHSEEECAKNIFQSADCFNTDLNTIKMFNLNSVLKFKVKIEVA